MMSQLVIVESPTKAKTISKFLGRGFTVKSSFGHVRDLPKSKLGVDIEHGFTPQYVVSRDKSAVVKELKTAAGKAKAVLFATDEDREGEAISYHLAHLLGIEPAAAQRIVFHEITKSAIEEALKSPRALDLRLVDAQQARRVLDRLVGYNLSPFLWRKVARGLSAGRVQSVAVRLVVEREREIQNFKPEEYWTIEGKFVSEDQGSKIKDQEFIAKLYSIAGKRLEKFDLKTKAQVEEIVPALRGAAYTIADVTEKKVSRLPPAPFTTSSLQQEANNQLGFSAKQTMRLAQQLYEGVELGTEGSVGLITYMRTDAVNLSEKFLTEAHNLIGSQFGSSYQLTAPRRFKNKNKTAQEAHEAIRPAEVQHIPEAVQPYLDRPQFRLYDLIWRRAVATQMAAAELNATTIDIVSHNDYGFRATGQTIMFDGFLKLYPDRAKENILPRVTSGQPVNCRELKPEQHFTEPPARYSDATLVKALEEYGIGRPSTYAPTLATIEERGYVERDDKKKLKPKDIALVVNDLLTEHFPQVVDYQFTAQMEENLDAIAAGTKDWQPIIATFYHPFKENLDQKDATLNKKALTEEPTEEVCEKCGQPMVIKLGRFGKFLACRGYPGCKNTKPFGQEEKEAAARAEESNEKCAKCGAPMQVKRGRFGSFLGCSRYPECRNIKRIEIKTDVKCPQCREGDIVQRRSKRGRIFYGCNRYPECDFALWDKPTGETCPDSGDLLVYGARGIIKCSKKECSYKKSPT
ncbi:MAG: type I DNA topoisomerase [Candidatus Magasanikbacteria bacterium]|nr:type I DNA topoisomerase [Candidatus Magasanikbacteria bacterium]